MTLQCINPDDLPIPEMYTQVVVATGSKLVFVSGQQPEDIQAARFCIGQTLKRALRGAPGSKPSVYPPARNCRLWVASEAVQWHQSDPCAHAFRASP